MSIATEITRLQTAKSDIKSAIEAKGVTVPSSAKIDTYDDYVSLISRDCEGFIGMIERSATAITIPSGTTTIGEYAFYQYSGLTSIDIPNSVTSIGKNAFQNCSGLTSIDIPSGVTDIGSNAFNGCSGLTSVTIPSGITTIGIYTFYRCISLTSIDIPSGVTNINNNAFYGCSGLTSITVNATTPPTLGTMKVFDETNNCPIYVPCESVETYKAASGWSKYASRIVGMCPKYKLTLSDTSVVTAACDSTSAVTSAEISPYRARTVAAEIGDCVTSIGDYVFNNCTSLTSITIPNSVTSIGQAVFTNCSSLPIENNIRYADTYAIETIDKTLSAYNLKEGTRFIGQGAFKNCTNLTGMTIQDSVINICNDAFQGCTNLIRANSETDGVLNLSNNITTIGSQAFHGCSGIKNVIVGSGITSIGNNAFSTYSTLQSITINATTPPTISQYTFNSSATNNCPIYVPAASVNAYKTASVWSTYYASRIQAIP